MKLYNSLTNQKEEFKPFVNKKVGIYVCGITPYDTTHLGHAFTYMFFDVLIRYLKHKKYEVKYAQNVTDIDDDILKKAKKENMNWQKLGIFWTNKFLFDLNSMNINLPDIYCLATDSITQIIQIIKVLVEKQYAYEKNGKVYFDIKNFKGYGELSKLSVKQMILLSRERGADPDDPFKKNPLDFILWQKSKIDEPSWESPWPIRKTQGKGKGRPGWHIECSAMINQYLGNQIEIHGGGHDLIFPHHESEIAQSESYTNKKPFVKYWMHTAMVMYGKEKMSKSLGNLVMVSDLLKKYTPNELKYFLLTNHYRKPWEYFEEKMTAAKNDFSKIQKAINGLSLKKTAIEPNQLSKFENLMNNDLNTPLVLKYLLSLTERILTEKDKNQKESLQKVLLTCLSILGFKG